MKMTFKTLLITSAITVSGLSFTACTTTQPVPPKKVKQAPAAPVKSEAQKHKEYNAAMGNVKKKIKADPNYKKLGLKTSEEKNWFTDLTYGLWDKKISREQFIANGLKKRPENLHEFNVIADGLLSS